MSHEGLIVNESSIFTHAGIESDLTDDEKNQLTTFGKMGSIGLNAKNWLICLFTNRTYDLSLIYRIVKQHRILQFGDSSDCMIKLVDLGSIHKSKEGIFEMTSDNVGRLETLHWSNPLSRIFEPVLSEFFLIDGIHKTNIYNLSLIVTTVVDSLGKYVPLGFLLAPSEHSESITRHKNLLKLTGNNCINPSYKNSRSIMNDKGSTLVKVASDMAGYHHYLCVFHINQLAVRVISFFTTKFMLSSLNCQHTFLIYVCHRIKELSHLIINIYHHVSVHFVRQKVRCHYGLFRWINIFIMTTYICVYEMYVVMNCLIWSLIFIIIFVHFVKQNVRSHCWLFRWINIFIMSMYICVCEIYVVVNCHILCILYHLQIKLINNFLFFIVFVKKCGGMIIAIKVEFLRKVSFFLYRSWVFNTEEDFQDFFHFLYKILCLSTS